LLPNDQAMALTSRKIADYIESGVAAAKHNGSPGELMPSRHRAATKAPRRPWRLGAQRSSLMNVGRRVDYALRAMCYLAAQPAGKVVSCAEIQACQGVPLHFLSKILRKLVAARLLESVPGARGGFRLGRKATEISIRDVYECIEGHLSLVDCVEHREGFCCYASVCTQIDVWGRAQQILSEFLGGVSIQQIADEQGLRRRLTPDVNSVETPA
jgi:Rrf2 family protein